MIEWAEWKRLLREERLPCAIVDLDAFDRNARALAALATAESAGGAEGRTDGGRPSRTLRLATKSVRVPALIRRALDQGAPYRGLMCYSALEARWLHAQGFDDFLVAYPSVQPSDLAALRALHDRGARVALVIDSAAHLEALARSMQGVSTPFRAVVDADLSLKLFGARGAHLGVRRSPVRGAGDLEVLARAAERHRGAVRLAGIMGYEAQVAGLGDRNPFKPLLNWPARLVRAWSVRLMRSRRAELAGAFARLGIELEIFNGGGTGSLSYCSSEPWLTEVTAGSGLFCPHLFDYYSNVALEPAAFFALQAVRSSDAGFVTCQGGGYIASGEPGWDKVPRPWQPRDLSLVSAEGCGEVQTPLRDPGRAVALGDPVLFRHAKAGELMERFNEVLLVSGDRITDRVPTYRGLGQSFF